MGKYFITAEGNQGVSWEEGNQRITEVYDRKYRLRDFFKPALGELLIMFAEIPFTSLPIFAMTQDFPESFGYAAIPQALTYIGFRAYELLGKNEYLKGRIRRQKIPFPGKRR